MGVLQGQQVGARTQSGKEGEAWGQGWPEAGEEPRGEVPPSWVCAAGTKGPPLSWQVWGNPENPSRLGCNLLCLAWSLSGVVERPAESGHRPHRAATRRVRRREGSELFPSIHLRTRVSRVLPQ